MGTAGGRTIFLETATGGMANIVNQRGSTGSEGGGRALFFGASSAGTSTITNEGGAGVVFASSASPGYTEFHETSTAGSATITNASGGTSLGFGGITWLFDHAEAGTATMINEGSAFTNGEGGKLIFQDSSHGGSAMIINRGGTAADANGGQTDFYGTSAGSATIINKAPVSAPLGGFTTFTNSSAAMATITAEGSSIAGESLVAFEGSLSTAAASTLTALGATGDNGLGGLVSFSGSSTAGEATLTATSGQVAGAPGGRFVFQVMADGGTASAVMEAGAAFDISGLFDGGMGIGSIAGAGTFFLGNKELTVGGNNADTTFAGVIADGGGSGGVGGSLTKAGLGTLTLDGANTYTGLTTVIDGTLTLNGPLPNATIHSVGGVLNVNGDIGGSTVEVALAGGPAVANFSTSQQLASLEIGNGGLMVLLSGASAPAFGEVVPEPGAGTLLLLAVLALPNRRRLSEGLRDPARNARQSSPGS